MKIYLNSNVFDEALNRIRFIFDEFENVIIGFSGGKDSTVTLELALIVAKEKNRLPLGVMFIDQEAEWEHVVKYVESVMYRDDINPYWLQMPMMLSNATSAKNKWLMCWEDGGDWMREKNDISIKKNKYGTDRFHKIFDNFLKVELPNEK